MARFYKRVLTEALSKVVEESLAEKPDEQFAVFEEIALVRVHAARSVELYGAALEQNNPEAICLAGTIMAEHLTRVVDLCKIANQIQTIQKDKYSVHDLNYVIDQIIRISFDIFGDSELANTFALRVRKELQLTSLQPIQTTPAQLAEQMHKATLGLTLEPIGITR